MNTLISFIIVLGILIFVHEFGHFICAKMFRVKVLKFSLGFGPTLVGKQIGETEYVISAFPLGGYVKMYGENPNDEVEENLIARSFAHKPVWQRFLIVASGPVFNLFFAVFLYFLIYSIFGLPQTFFSTKIAAVAANTPAEAVGLKKDDVIIAIDGQKTEKWGDIVELIGNSEGKPVTLAVKRGDETVETLATPEKKEEKNIFGEPLGSKRYVLGIERTNEIVEIIYEKVSVYGAFKWGVLKTWDLIYLTFITLLKIFQRVVPASELGGPILIAQLAGQQMKAGLLYFTNFMAFISIQLGILNLLPVPILDGGHLVFFSVEALRGKPLSMKTQEMWQQVGLVLLISLMFFVFYNDLVRLFTHG